MLIIDRERGRLIRPKGRASQLHKNNKIILNWQRCYLNLDQSRERQRVPSVSQCQLLVNFPFLAFCFFVFHLLSVYYLM